MSGFVAAVSAAAAVEHDQGAADPSSVVCRNVDGDSDMDLVAAYADRVVAFTNACPDVPVSKHDELLNPA